MNYATIKNRDIANGPGVRVSLFVSGCTHHCKGCFNAVASGELFCPLRILFCAADQASSLLSGTLTNIPLAASM